MVNYSKYDLLGSIYDFVGSLDWRVNSPNHPQNAEDILAAVDKLMVAVYSPQQHEDLFRHIMKMIWQANRADITTQLDFMFGANNNV